jgi:hypothetical protein
MSRNVAAMAWRGAVATALAVAGALVLAAAPAAGGGWATVGLSSTPEGTAPGKPWDVTLTLLQHGRTPLEGVHPRVIIWPADGGKRQTFAARATREAGEYRARVTFPTAGRWSYAVNDGFVVEEEHTFAPVQIGGPASAPAVPAPASEPASATGGGPDWWLASGAALAAGLLAAGLVWLLARVRSRGPAPVRG